MKYLLGLKDNTSEEKTPKRDKKTHFRFKTFAKSNGAEVLAGKKNMIKKIKKAFLNWIDHVFYVCDEATTRAQIALQRLKIFSLTLFNFGFD